MYTHGDFFKNDSYFLGDVAILIEPRKKYNYTQVKAIVLSNEEKEHRYEWLLDVDLCSENPKEILEEIKKEKYWTEGYSETF